MKIGMDIGSTTLKCVAVDDAGTVIFKAYERHLSQITSKAAGMLQIIARQNPTVKNAAVCISGSAGMGLACQLGLPFLQEVYATRLAIRRLLPDTDTVIELGGEDAKILFLSGGTEVRMNGSCAGGTGAFIDQMASLMRIALPEMNALAAQSEKCYTIASRCGVFAKSDIQPLLNQGARKSDICASIFKAVVNQTVAGLAQGREINGRVVYLGGPLSFLPMLRKSFDETLKLSGHCPENSLYFVALGAAYSTGAQTVDLRQTAEKIRSLRCTDGYAGCAPLFRSQSEYESFCSRHRKNRIRENAAVLPGERLFLGVDAGSTTIKVVVINLNREIVFSRYLPNDGTPVPVIKACLEAFYSAYPGAAIEYSAVTGYGEEMIRNAFCIDTGIVETVAHYTAAREFLPAVDFIIDIGGQDIKCFRIRNGAIDNIFLNEACSSGCGSFLQSFANARKDTIADFAALGLFAEKPVDLGSRCTVFMNSSVKQAQKDGASIENISAGLSISVVKNALYKVIRTANAAALGENIVVQGGTFCNDAVLRAFEMEIGREVVRPNISGLMGAYGAALYAMQHSTGKSSLPRAEALQHFVHTVRVTHCTGCQNHCLLTVNTFNGKQKFIGGNRCQKPVSGKQCEKQYNLYQYKRTLLQKYRSVPGALPTVGLPMGLNLYELLPFWHTFFTRLGFGVAVSPPSTRALYCSAQHTIPSDTVCYPAKLMHAHTQALLSGGVSNIFYPCMTYHLDEHLGDNHYNCPVVAYYPEVLRANMSSLSQANFICEYLGLHRRDDFVKKIHAVLCRRLAKVPLRAVKEAVDAAFEEYHAYREEIRRKGEEYLETARKKNLHCIVLCGRPYHLDGEINHGIDKLICECGAVLITEDAVSQTATRFPTAVLNQWTYHARLYAAARYVSQSNENKLNLIQLVSFGCGVDAITTDEVRSILESRGKIYTQIKIDEITNSGAVKIRLRSLFAALDSETAAHKEEA